MKNEQRNAERADESGGQWGFRRVPAVPRGVQRLAELGMPGAAEALNQDSPGFRLLAQAARYCPDDQNAGIRLRTHPLLVQVVEELGSEASGECSCLRVEMVDRWNDWHLRVIDGRESIRHGRARDDEMEYVVPEEPEPEFDDSPTL